MATPPQIILEGHGGADLLTGRGGADFYNLFEFVAPARDVVRYLSISDSAEPLALGIP